MLSRGSSSLVLVLAVALTLVLGIAIAHGSSVLMLGSFVLLVMNALMNKLLLLGILRVI